MDGTSTIQTVATTFRSQTLESDLSPLLSYHKEITLRPQPVPEILYR
jgi:hypothetical protein